MDVTTQSRIRVLRFTFILLAVLALLNVAFVYSVILFLVKKPLQISLLQGAALMAAIVVDFAYIYAGVMLRSLLLTSPSRLKAILIANGALIAIDIAFKLQDLLSDAMTTEAKAFVLLSLALRALITWFLYRDVHRLSAIPEMAVPQ